MRSARVWLAGKLVGLARRILEASSASPDIEVEDEGTSRTVPGLTASAFAMLLEGEELAEKVEEASKLRAAKANVEPVRVGSLRHRIETARRNDP